ncbi:MAG: TetR/AcrR family transcriptional regulator [Myxococcales bacterium]|nr:TetR/AcrR family transcriptional regulator [Myxococcales bacterium]
MGGREQEMEGRTYGGLSPAERAERRRDAFVQAGLEVFGTSGFRTATVRGVCEQAGLVTRYFYESFDNMEALLGAVFEDCLNDLLGRLDTTFEAPGVAANPKAMIVAGLKCFFAWAEDPRVARVCLREVVGVSPSLDALWTRTMKGFVPMLVALARGVYPSSEIDELEAEVLAIAVTGALSQAALRWHVDGHRIPRETMIAATARVLRGIQLTIEADLASAPAPD